MPPSPSPSFVATPWRWLLLALSGLCLSLSHSSCALFSQLGEDIEALRNDGKPKDLDQILALPESWASTPEAQAGVDSQWLRSLGGKTLVALVDEAQANNPDLQASAFRVIQAREQARIAAGQRLPFLNLNFNGQRQRQNFIGFPTAGGQEGEVATARNNLFQLLAEIQWEVDVWGRLKASRDASIAEFAAVAADEQAARVSLEAQVARAYFALAEAQQQQSLAQESLEALKKTEQVLTRRFESGDDRSASAAQVRLSRSDIAEAEASLTDRKRQLEDARRQLELLLGRYPAAQVQGLQTLPAPPKAPPAGLPSELLLRRPDLLAAQARLLAGEKRVSEALRSLFPSIQLTANAGTSTDALENILNSEFGVWSLAGGVAQPILRGGQIRAEYRNRQAAEGQALANLQNTVLQAFGEVEQALAAESWLLQQEASLLKAVQLAENAFDSARADYASGGADVLTLLETQRRSIQLRASALQLRRARLDNRISLHLALGGSFQPQN